MPQDERIATFEFDAETDRKVMERLKDAGIAKRDDLGSGRADAGLLSRMMDEAGVDAEVAPLLAEKVMRDANWKQMAEGAEQPTPAGVKATEDPKAAPSDRLADMQAKLEQAAAEAALWKQKYGERESRLGEERRQTAERLARLEMAAQGRTTGYTPASPVPVVPQGYDPRILGDRDPNTPLTAGEVAALLQLQSMAFGAQMSQREQQILEAARALRDYDLTNDEEADLINRHNWLVNLDRTTQVKAMRELVKTVRPVAATAPSQTPKVDMLELARARNRQATTFIEPSSQGSPQEASAATSVDSALATKAAKLKELLATPGGSAEAEKLMADMQRTQGRRF